VEFMDKDVEPVTCGPDRFHVAHCPVVIFRHNTAGCGSALDVRAPKEATSRAATTIMRFKGLMLFLPNGSVRKILAPTVADGRTQWL
jgi:hypothetical protein